MDRGAPGPLPRVACGTCFGDTSFGMTAFARTRLADFDSKSPGVRRVLHGEEWESNVLGFVCMDEGELLFLYVADDTLA